MNKETITNLILSSFPGITFTHKGGEGRAKISLAVRGKDGELREHQTVATIGLGESATTFFPMTQPCEVITIEVLEDESDDESLI